jgi:hypothetical protein
MSNSIYLRGPFKIFVLVMVMLSFFGGYLRWHLIYEMNDYYQQRTEKVLAMQNSIDDATIALGRQIQEWKDMLLRANDMELYSKHKKAFFEYGINVQQALLRTKTAMQSEQMETAMVEQLIIEHQTLSSDYLMAKSFLNPREIDSFREVDKKVNGIDRSLQKQLAATRDDIIHFSKQQLDEARSARGNGFLAGLFEACSLISMTLAGFVMANWFAGNNTRG